MTGTYQEQWSEYMDKRVIPVISDAAVRSKTDKTWKEWVTIIDRLGGKEKSHREIVSSLRPYELGGWWEQMVTVTYEQVRGLRQQHERPSGYAIGVSRVINVGLSHAYRAWTDEQIRRRWLKAPALTVRRVTRNRTIRITWADGRTTVDAGFHRLKKAKTRVTVQHERLPSARAAARMKLYWSRGLDRLKSHLEK